MHSLETDTTEIQESYQYWLVENLQRTQKLRRRYHNFMHYFKHKIKTRQTTKTFPTHAGPKIYILEIGKRKFCPRRGGEGMKKRRKLFMHRKTDAVKYDF